MFGVPDYFSIDPTPFLTLTFLAFFGNLFRDGVYASCSSSSPCCCAEVRLQETCGLLHLFLCRVAR